MRVLLIISFATLLLVCFSQGSRDPTSPALLESFNSAEKLFQKSDRMFLEAGDDPVLQENADQAYREAIRAFEPVLRDSRKAGFDSLSVLAALRLGLIHYYLGETPEAKRHYLDALNMRRQAAGIPDSVFFIPLIYTGGIYHGQNAFDSALFYYQAADRIQSAYADPLPESERLYNRLGVMLYENGNFRQARNYFEKALELTGSENLNLATNYRINIASIHVKLEELPQALALYESLLETGIYPNEVHHNLAIVKLKLGSADAALSHLRKVDYENDRKSIDLNYNFALAFHALGQKDSSERYFQNAVAENAKWNGERKNVPFGLLLRFRAEQLLGRGRVAEALQTYQQSIIQLHAAFNDEDIRFNPEQFGEAFSYINLFRSLSGKADAFEKLYENSGRTEDLESALDAYESAFRLAHFIERSYESDEARLFLNRIKHSAHSRPIDLCIRLYRLTEEKRFLENAYLFDQRNKASVLWLSVQENELRLNATHPLLQKEAGLRTALTRLSLRAAAAGDSAELSQLATSIRDTEIELGKIQQELSQLPAYQSRLLAENIPSVKEVQQHLDHQTALLSWHLSEKDLLALVIRRNAFTYRLIPVDSGFIALLDSFRAELETVDALKRFGGTEPGKRLHALLMRPLQPELAQAGRLIIIPDDELSYLPFESLTDENDSYLLRRFAIQYQFSTHFLTRKVQNKKQKGTLAIAPFAKRGFTDESGGRLSALPASLEEVRDLKGSILIDSVATKKNFLKALNHFGTIHLATHAFVNDSNSALSFIAFYPDGNGHKLYAREIYDLRLDSTSLVILSACKTGMGRLVKGEGLMSLSRAFAFAGCQNIIMSLWMAEDKTTAYITRRLHHYLGRGMTRDESLRLAKQDLLDDPDIDPRFKTPNYWAHLMYIGEYEKGRGSRNWVRVAGALLAAGIFFLLYQRARRKN